MLTRSSSLPLKHVAFSFSTQRYFNTSSTLSTRLPKGVSGKSNTLIGPPDPISNLRPIKITRSENETPTERKLRELQIEAQEFNQKFWLEHNREFTKGRAEYVKKVLQEKYPHEKGKTTINANEMSVFYKTFLDAHWKSHLDYNKQWQRRNFQILFLAYRVKLQTIFSRNRL